MPSLKSLVPRPIRDKLRPLVTDLRSDWLERRNGRTDPMLPPPSLRHIIGAGDFKAIGSQFVQHLIELKCIHPDSDVLEVGCGCGRVAVPLTQYLSESGSYAGFDIMPKLIRWCQRQITKSFPRFVFLHADLYNSFYNPKGKKEAASFVFPYPDSSFDCVFLTSVFTHMSAEAVAHYLMEVARVLRPGGSCLGTYFLFNDESDRITNQVQGNIVFPHQRGVYRLRDDTDPDAAICFEQVYIESLYCKVGLSIRQIELGSWCGRKGSRDYQDIVVAEKTGT